MLIAAAGVVIAAIAAPGARAADLGGDCCADLEERVAELEATTVRKGNRRVSVTLSGHVNRALLYWDDGFDSDVYSVDNAFSSSRFRLLGSARIHAELTAGFQFEMDNRLGARSNQVNQIDDDGFGGSGGILGGAARGDGIGGAGDSVLAIRLANWYLDHKHYGRLRVGRLGTSTNGLSTIDLGGITVIARSVPTNNGSAFLLRSGVGVLSSDNWNGLCAGNGGATGGGAYATDCGDHDTSRRDAVRYDTPTWFGFTASASWGEDDFWDAALRYTGEWHGFRFAGGVGYRVNEDQEPDQVVPDTVFRQLDNTDRRQWIASGSILHVPSGVFVDGAYVQFQWHGSNQFEINQLTGGNRPDIDLWYVAAGISRNWFGIGKTVPYAEYGSVTDGTTGTFANDTIVNGINVAGTLSGLDADGVVVDSDYRWWGLGIVQNIDAASMELYVGYRHFSADVTLGGPGAEQVPGGLEDLDVVMGGARLKF